MRRVLVNSKRKILSQKINSAQKLDGGASELVRRGERLIVGMCQSARFMNLRLLKTAYYGMGKRSKNTFYLTIEDIHN